MSITIDRFRAITYIGVITMYDKHKEEEKAVQEAQALRKQGREKEQQPRYRRQAENYNKVQFDKLFRS